MTTPTGTVHVWAEIQPSEDAQKICLAIQNVIPDIIISYNERVVSATSENLSVLCNIHNTITTRQTRSSLRRNLIQNTHNNTTHFYLNKQASFASTVAICGEQDESPLGPIRITLTSSDIESVIDWLCGKMNQTNNNF